MSALQIDAMAGIATAGTKTHASYSWKMTQLTTWSAAKDCLNAAFLVQHQQKGQSVVGVQGKAHMLTLWKPSG